jgi:hypothetical protein
MIIPSAALEAKVKGINLGGHEVPRRASSDFEVPFVILRVLGGFMRLFCCLPSYDFALQPSNGAYHFSLFAGGYFELVKGVAQGLDCYVPVLFGDVQAGFRG